MKTIGKRVFIAGVVWFVAVFAVGALLNVLGLFGPARQLPEWIELAGYYSSYLSLLLAAIGGVAWAIGTAAFKFQ
jgi:hypothetical protein